MKQSVIALASIALFTANAFAGGYTRNENSTLTAQGKEAQLNSWLTDICGAKQSENRGWGWSWNWGNNNKWAISRNNAPKNQKGDTYFIAVNQYWVGQNYGNSNVYDQINKGVTDIQKITEDYTLKTNSGTFYTHNAENANKFFFITRRASMKTSGYEDLAFAYYDEWSYVKNGEGDYNTLTASYNNLKDGQPLFAPHNCGTSLENNHYVSLNAKEDDNKPGYNFTVFFFLPNNTEKNSPYMFFYTNTFAGSRSSKHAISSTLDCPYDAVLTWNTVFDKYASQVSYTTYEGMKERYIIERSYDNKQWETLEGIAEASGNNMKSAAGKTFTDNTLKDFDETTAKTGYSVYYRLTSIVEKANGTEMARRTAENTVEIVIPGTSPLAITLGNGSTSTYTDGENQLTDVLNISKTDGHDELIFGKGAKIELLRSAKAVASYEVTDGEMTVDQLISKITANNVYTNSQTAEAGEASNAKYQVRLTLANGEEILSNEVSVVRNNVNDAIAKVFRSGTPDKNTCADTELLISQLTFTPANSGIGTGYYIYRNGEIALTLTDNGNLTFTDQNGVKYAENENGTLNITLTDEVAPIAEGENGEITNDDANSFYSVVSFTRDENGENTFGNAAIAPNFVGTADELQIELNTTKKSVGYGYNTAYIRTSLQWQNLSDEDPIRYEIYRKIEKADIENGTESDGSADASSKDQQNAPFGQFVKIAETTDNYYNDDFYYNRIAHSQITDEEVRSTAYYVKAIYSDNAEVAQNVAEKNSAAVAITSLSEGSIFTAVESVKAEDINVTAEGGVITVNGANGKVTVYNANGQEVASAEANGETITIDAAGLNGVYFVSAEGCNTTKVLVK